MNPALGRFNTVDSLAEKYYSISPYVYVGDNPLKLIDPDGKDWKDIVSKSSSYNIKNIIAYFQGNLRYKLFYSNPSAFCFHQK